jgi:hypothetical protein
VRFGNGVSQTRAEKAWASGWKLRETFFREILRISAQKAGKRRRKLYNVLKIAK